MPNVGLARLRVALRGERSVVTHQFGKAPLQVHAPLYLADANYPTVYLRTPSAGLLDGDENRLDVHIDTAALLEVRTQAAMLVYPGKSLQTINIHVDEDAELTYLPHPLILSERANFKQIIRIELAPTAKLRFWDNWCAGRIAMGECWRFEQFDNLIEIRRAGALVYRERWTIKPTAIDLTEAIVCDRFTHFRTICEFGNSMAVDHTYSQNARVWSMQREKDRITRIADRNHGATTA